MPSKNKYLIRARISEAKFRQVIRLYAMDIEATKIAQLSGLSRNSINKLLAALRRRLAELCEAESPLRGTVEVDESYFGARRVRGRRGRGARGKIPVIGLLKRKGKVYTQVLANCSSAALETVIRGKVRGGSVIHTDGWRGYDGLIDLGYKRHYRVHHHANEFARGRNHINGIESFWGYAKMRLARLRGIPRSTFYWHLKESEFRFNHRKENLDQLILNLVRQHPLKLS
jgi:transposase-like protein